MPIPRVIKTDRDHRNILHTCLIPLDIRFSVYFDETCIHNNIELKDEQSLLSLYFEKAKWAFRFNMTIPDPVPMSTISSAEIRGLQNNSQDIVSKIIFVIYIRKFCMNIILELLKF